MHLRWTRIATFVLAAVYMVPVLACNEDSDVETIVMAVVEAYGGEEALRSVEGFRMMGDQLAIQNNQMIKVARWFGRPDRLRLELAYPDHHESRFTEGVVGWAGANSADVSPANPIKLQAMRLQTARLDPPIRLLERLEEVKRLEDDAQGRILLRIPIGPDLLLDSHVDPTTYRITKMTMWMPGPPAMEFSAEYDQFHEIAGVLIAFRELTYAGNTVTSRFQVTDFEWNPEGLSTTLKHHFSGLGPELF